MKLIVGNYYENMKVCQKQDGRIYLRAKDQFIKKINQRNEH